MHSQSPPLTIGGTVLKESDDFVILRVTFDSKVIFEEHLCRSVSRAASQRFDILRKSWRVFHDKSLLGRCFLGFVGDAFVLEYWARIIEMTYDSVSPRLVISPRQVPWNINSFMLIYIVKKSENRS